MSASTNRRARPRRPAPVTAEELQRLLMDTSVPEKELRPYLEIDTSQSRPFDPAVRVDRKMVEVSAEEGAFALASLNAIARWRRQRTYRDRIDSWDGPVAVSEGDSWFQFPFLLDDVIDQLNKDYAIFSLGAAGDLLADIVVQDELVGAIQSEQPDVVFLSGGGNDLLGGGRLATVLAPFKEGRPADEYPTEAFDAVLRQALDQYANVLEAALVAGAPAIVCHSYDYAIPDGGRWLGRPLASLDILDAGLQREIIKVLMDRFFDGMSQLVAQREFRGRVVLADCRGKVGEKSAWWDELHPKDQGFLRVARTIRQAASAVGREAGREAVGLGAFAENDAGLLFDEHDDMALYAELGRRVQLMRARPETAGLAGMAVEVTLEEGLFDPLVVMGRRVLRRLHRELHEFLCGEAEEDVADRARLKKALGLNAAAVTAAITGILIGSLGVAPLVAPIVAALIYRVGIAPTMEELCSAWSDALAE